MPTAYVQKGVENVGKSSTIRLLYQLLLERFPKATVEKALTSGNEIRVVITIDGFKVGLESFGDPWKKDGRIVPSLHLFVRLECEIIVCAARSRGGTVDVVAALERKGYEVIWRTRPRVTGKAQQDAANRKEAVWILAQIENRLLATA